jgi:DNA-binding LytR/AlgR family response regulator
MRILIIEDEIPAATQLAKMVRKCKADASIEAILDSVTASVEWLQNNLAPDLIFMDIQIADGLSFDIFKKVSVTSPVIFTTAFDHYAIQAFKVNAIDYLLKPLDPTELNNALERFDMQKGLQTPVFDLSMIQKMLNKQQYKERFLVKTGNQLTFIQTKDIAYFRSSDGLTQAYMQNGKKFFVDHSLEELESLVDPKDFFRTSRHLFVKLTSIHQIAPHLNGRFKLDLNPKSEEEVYVSRERAADFKEWLGA